MHSIRDKLEGQNTKLAEHKGIFRNHPIIPVDDHEGSFFLSSAEFMGDLRFGQISKRMI